MTLLSHSDISFKKLSIFVILFCLLINFNAFGCPPVENPNDEDAEVGDPVSVTSGKIHSYHQDMLIPGRGGLSLEISRNYYGKSDYTGPFGASWSFTYGMNITQKTASTVILLNEDGKTEKYLKSGSTWYSPKGNFSTLTKNTDGSWVLKRKDKLTYNFNSSGKLTNITDRNGNYINLTYTSNRLTSVYDNCARSLTFAYNTAGLITSITWSNGQVTTYAYDVYNNLAKVTDPEGNQIKYAYTYYDGIFQLITATDARNNSTSFAYYDDYTLYGTPNYLKCKNITNPDGTTMSLTYNESLRFTQVTNERGYVTRYDYDADENITVVTDPKGNITRTAYDSNFNKISTTDALGYITYYTYDTRGNCLSIKDPLNRITNFTYEPTFNFVKTATDVKGNITTYYYDYEEASSGDLNGDGVTNQAGGNLVKIVYPAVSAGTPAELFVYNQYGQIIQQTDTKGAVTKYNYYASTGYLQNKTSDYGHINSTVAFAYDALGNVTSVTDPLNRITTLEYNKMGILKKSTSPAPFNYQTKYTYDGNNNPVKIERQMDSSGSSWQVTENTYDARDRITSVKEYPSGSSSITTSFTYDAGGNKITQTDANSNVTTYTYDSTDLLIKTTDAEGKQTENTYDNNGKLVSLKDANSNITTYAYDNSGWLIKTTYPDLSYETYTPDLNSNIASKRTRKGDIITYTYDNLNRLITKACSSYPTITYTYDIASRLTAVTDTSYPIAYTYDALNRLSQVTYPGPKNVSYEYDIASNRTKLTYPDSSYITYSYDNLNRLTQVTSNQSSVASYTYDVLSRRTAASLANSTQTAYSYDNLGRLLSMVNKLNSGTNISNFAYTYDNVGNRNTMDEARGTSASARTSYTYDKIYQVKAVDYPSGYTYLDTSYLYDPVGNRTQLSGGTIETYTPNNLNQYSKVGSVNYTYDQNGNLTNDGVFTYSYDYENRLTSATKSGTTVAYTYDAFGRRISKTVNGTSTKFLYNDDQIIAEYNSSGTLTKKFIYGLNVDEPILVDNTTNKYYYHLNGLGSVTDITNSTGAIVERYFYDIYGKTTIKDASNNVISQSSIGNRYAFTGRELDLETGLYYYRARYYNPLIGRFLQTDPVGYSAGINLYAYCSNNSVNYTDPMGKCKEEGSSWLDMDWWNSDLLWDFMWHNLFEPPYNTLTQPGYNYGLWLYGEQSLRNFYGACLDSAWLIGNAFGAGEAIAANGTPYWQYYPKENPGYRSPWLVRSDNPPYELGEKASQALNLPYYNTATAVRKMNVNPWGEVIRGGSKGRPVDGGTGREWARGILWPK